MKYKLLKLDSKGSGELKAIGELKQLQVGLSAVVVNPELNLQKPNDSDLWITSVVKKITPLGDDSFEFVTLNSTYRLQPLMRVLH